MTHLRLQFQPKLQLGKFLLLGLLPLLWPESATADCRYRMDAQGNTSYSCDSGASGTLRPNAFGSISDTGTGIQYKKDNMGNIRSSQGRTYRQDAFGEAHQREIRSRRPLTRSSRPGRAPVCRMTAFGELRCR